MPTTPFASPIAPHANAWEREMLRVLNLADSRGVSLRLSVLVAYDVRDLQRLRWELESADEKPGWWQRLLQRRSRSSMLPSTWNAECT